MKKAVVIDGNSLTYRAFYATYKQAEYAIEHDIIPNNAIRLMALMCFKIIENKNYDYALVAFDSVEKTFRAKQYAQYKAGRKKMPDALVQQLPVIKKVLGYMGFHIIAIPEIEADDIIGSFCKVMFNENIFTDVFSSDQDMLQLVNKITNVNILKTGVSDIKVYTDDNFLELYDGLRPNQVIDYKGIVGDSSDNLPGVKGIGKKTGLKLILKYDNLENIIKHKSDLSDNLRNKIELANDEPYLCKELATIKINVLDNSSSKDYLFIRPNYSALREIFMEYNINNLGKYLEPEQPTLFDGEN